MNCNVYIFGELSSGYTQYPEDSSSHVLKNIYPFCKAPTQIAIRRDASMMYYCYIRKLNDNKYFGLSIAVNGYYISRVDELFSLFENTIEKIAQQGSFIHFAKDGSLTTSTTILKDEEEEIDTLSENLRRGFEKLDSSLLPPVDYTVSKDSVKEFNALDDKQDIVRASYTYGYTFIYKDKDYDTVRVKSYRSVLSQLNNENNNLRKRNEELKKQKKRTTLVAVLSIILLIGALIIGLLFTSIKQKNAEIQQNEQAYTELKTKHQKLQNYSDNLATENKNLKQENTDLTIALNQETTRRKDAENKRDNYKFDLDIEKGNRKEAERQRDQYWNERVYYKKLYEQYYYKYLYK